MNRVDINCDLGESFGLYKMGKDEEILPFITSANIACGFHAGDPHTMKKTVELALKKGVAIGAHPGLPDLRGFGRRNMDISAQEAYDMVLYQVGALSGYVRAEGQKMQHVKPHGALYNMAAKNQFLAEAIAEAIYKLEPELILFGLAGSELVKAGKKIGLRVAQEVFSDRTYQSDGSLTSRIDPEALITDEKKAVNQVLTMIKTGKVRSLQGTDVPIQADTICLHGDNPNAVTFAKSLQDEFAKAKIIVQAINR